MPLSIFQYGSRTILGSCGAGAHPTPSAKHTAAMSGTDAACRLCIAGDTPALRRPRDCRSRMQSIDVSARVSRPEPPASRVLLICSVPMVRHRAVLTAGLDAHQVTAGGARVPLSARLSQTSVAAPASNALPDIMLRTLRPEMLSTSTSTERICDRAKLTCTPPAFVAIVVTR